MAATIETKVEDLKVLFNRISDVYFADKAIEDPSTALTLMAIPVGSDGVNFDAGDPDITKYKITTGATWTSIADAADADISLQVPSVHDKVTELFQNKVTTAKKSLELDGATYEGNGFDFAPKKVTGAFLFRSQDKETVIILTNVEVYAAPKLDDTGKPLYFNLNITPLNNTAGVAIYYMTKKAVAEP